MYGRLVRYRDRDWEGRKGKQRAGKLGRVWGLEPKEKSAGWGHFGHEIHQIVILVF